MSDINLIISATDNASRALNQINNKLGSVEAQASKMTGMGKAMGRAFIGAAAAFATIGVVSKVKDTIDNMDELAKRARNVGVTSELAFGQFQVASKLLEEGGLSVGEADRAFRNLNTRIEKGLGGNKAYAEAMKGLGDSIFDANGKLKSTPELFAAVAQGVQNGSIDIEDAQKLLGEVVGPKIFNLFKDMEERGITASEAFKDVAENIALVDLKKAQDAEAFNDALGRLSEGLNQLLIDAVGPLLPAMTEFIQDILAKMPEFVEMGRGALDRLHPLFSLLGTILTEAVIPMLDSFITFIGNVASAITPLVEASLPIFVELFEKAKERGLALVEALVPLAEKTLPYIKEGFDLIVKAGDAVITFLADMYEKYAPGVGEALGNMGAKMAELYDTYMPTLVSVLTSVGAKISELYNTIIPPLMEILGNVGSKMAELYETYAPGLIEALGTIGSKALELYTEYLKFLFDMLVTIGTKVYELAQTTFPYLVTAFDTIKGAVNKTVEVLGPFISKTIENLKAGVALVSEKFNQLITFLKEIYEVVVPAIEAAFAKVTETIDKIKGAIEEFTKTFTEMKDKVVEKGKAIKEGVGNAMSEMADGVTQASKNAYDGVTGWFDEMADYLYENSVVPDMRDAIIASFDEMATGMIAAAETGTTGVSEKFDKLDNELRRKTANISRFAKNMSGLGYDMTGFTVDQAEEFIGQMDDVAISISDARKQVLFNQRALKGLTGSFKAGHISIKEYVGALEYLGIEQNNFTSLAARSAVTIGEQFMAMSSSIASSMTEVIMGTKSGFDALGDIVKNTVKMIMQTLIQNFIVNPLMRNISSMFMGGGGGGGGLLGGLLGGGGSILGVGMSTFLPGFGLLAGIGGILGGLFADGGNTARAGQKPILVGERGPEVFLPGRAGTVIANEELNAMGGQGDLSVNFTINAIDTQTGVEFLLENKRVITGVIQEAYMRRGTSGPLG